MYYLIIYCFYFPLKNFSLIWRRHHCQWRAAKFWPMLGASKGLWAGRDLYRATPAVTRDLDSPGLDHPKDRPIQSPLTTRKGVRRTYSNPDPHRVKSGTLPRDQKIRVSWADYINIPIYQTPSQLLRFLHPLHFGYFFYVLFIKLMTAGKWTLDHSQDSPRCWGRKFGLSTNNSLLPSPLHLNFRWRLRWISIKYRNRVDIFTLNVRNI
jgi:hypothetical protein